MKVRIGVGLGVRTKLHGPEFGDFVDTVERLLDARGTVSRADIEAYAPDLETGFERGAATREFIARILRGVQQDMEALQAAERTLDEVSKGLRDT